MRGITHIRILLLFSMLSTIGSSCQGSTGTLMAERVTAHLTGGAQRQWTITAWKPVLALEGPKCVEGELWTFRHDGRWIKRTCENGMVREREFSWALVETADDQPVIEINETRYIVELRQKNATGGDASPELVTILRTLRSTQAEPVQEITLTYQQDR
jgi:hypothetical protein